MKKFLKYFATVIFFTLSYIYMFQNYANDKICRGDGQFLIVSLLYAFAAGCVIYRIRSNKYIKFPAGVKWLFLVAVPVVSFYIEEIVWNTGFYRIPIREVLVNSIIIGFILLIVCFITNKTGISSFIILSGSFLYGCINYFVMLYRGCPLRYGDFLATKTALTVMDKYELWGSNHMLVAFAIYVFMVLLLIFIMPGDFLKASKKKKYYIVKFTGLITTFVLMYLFFQVDYGKMLKVDMAVFDPLQEYSDNGAPVVFLITVQNSQITVPEGYSIENVEAMLQSYETDAAAELTKKPTIIVIMNESLTDYSIFDSGITSEDYLSFYHNTEEYIMKGYTYSSSYGGGTANSEFEFLLGASMANVGSGSSPFQEYNLSDSYGILDVVKKQGYETVAMHPYQRGNWNRPSVYAWLGFDTYLSQEDMPLGDVANWGMTDRCNYEYVIKAYENKKGPAFIYNVTIQNHGPYEDELQNVELQAMSDAYSKYEDVQKFVTLTNESDEAFEEFLDYFRNVEEPVVICMFGDHQPALDKAFMSQLTEQMPEGTDDIEKKQMRYVTPYIIWSNYETDINMLNQDMSINYLGANILKVAGFEDAYMNYLLALQENIPVINIVGYMDSEGKWHSFLEKHEKLDEYRKIQYYHLFEKK